MTLNELCDDILLEARNNQIAESEKLSKRQIELWIHTYRAMLIKQKMDKGDTADSNFTQHIIIHLDRIDNCGHIEYRSSEKLPKLIDFNNKKGVLNIKDLYGNIIQLGNQTKMKFQKYRKFTCKNYIAYVEDDYLYVEGAPHLLECVEAEIIAEDPTEAILCYNPDTDDYPISAHMWTTIKQLIFDRDLNIMRTSPSDITNDSKDDNQNINQKSR